MDANERGPAPDSEFAATLRSALTAAAAAGTLASPPSAGLLIDRIVRLATRVIPSPEGSFFLLDHEQQALVFDTVVGSTAAAVQGMSMPLGHGIAGLVAVSHQPIAVANAQEHPRHARDIAAKSGYFPTTILAVPVFGADGSIVGVLELLDRQHQPTYSLDDMKLLATFAELIGPLLAERQRQGIIAGMLGEALATLAGIPVETQQYLNDRATTFLASVESDPVTRQTVELARLVAAIAGRGPAEYDACVGVLNAFAGYAQAVQSPESDLETFR